MHCLPAVTWCLFDVELEIPETYYLKADRSRLSDNENKFCDWLLEHGGVA